MIIHLSLTFLDTPPNLYLLLPWPSGLHLYLTTLNDFIVDNSIPSSTNAAPELIYLAAPPLAKVGWWPLRTEAHHRGFYLWSGLHLWGGACGGASRQVGPDCPAPTRAQRRNKRWKQTPLWKQGIRLDGDEWRRRTKQAFNGSTSVQNGIQWHSMVFYGILYSLGDENLRLYVQSRHDRCVLLWQFKLSLFLFVLLYLLSLRCVTSK